MSMKIVNGMVHEKEEQGNTAISPTPERIAEMCAEFKKQWSPDEKLRRWRWSRIPRVYGDGE